MRRYTALTVKRIESEPLLTHRIVAKHQVREKVADLLKAVNLEADHMYCFPHQFSGGQRQRIGIARALAVNRGFWWPMNPSRHWMYRFKPRY